MQMNFIKVTLTVKEVILDCSEAVTKGKRRSTDAKGTQRNDWCLMHRWRDVHPISG